MDKIKTVKIKNEDGSISEESYTISVDARNVDMDNGKDLQDTIGNIDINTDGNISEQLEYLNENVDNLNIDIKKKAYFFNTVADMKAANLKVGDYACTLGYYSVNDGGNASYYITNIQNNIEYQENLNNNLYANLIVEYPLNVKRYGAKGDNTHDDTYIIQWVFNYSALYGGDIFFPKGNFKITAPITIKWGQSQTNVRPKLQKIYGCGSQTFETVFDSTVITGYNIPEFRGIIELLGEGNTWSTHTTISDLSIVQDKSSCNKNSFCLFYGDANQFELNKVKMLGYNDVFLRCGSNPDTTNRSYANINVRYINTAFRIFGDYEKGFSILPERIITGYGAHCDNILIESCLFEGISVIDCVLFNLKSCHIALRMPIKDKTTTNIGSLNGFEIDYSTGFLLTNFMTCNFNTLYCEDYRRAIDVLPMYGIMGNLVIENCYFNAMSNQFDSQNNRLSADYGIITRANANQSTWLITNMTVQNCVFRQPENFEFNYYAIENNIAKQLENINNINYPYLTDLNIHNTRTWGFYNKPLYHNNINTTYNVSTSNLARGRNFFKFENDNSYNVALYDSFLTKVELYFDTAVPNDEDFALIVLVNDTTGVYSIDKAHMQATTDKKVYVWDGVNNGVGIINKGDNFQFYLYSNTITQLVGKTVKASVTINH